MMKGQNKSEVDKWSNSKVLFQFPSNFNGKRYFEVRF